MFLYLVRCTHSSGPHPGTIEAAIASLSPLTGCLQVGAVVSGRIWDYNREDENLTLIHVKLFKSRGEWTFLTDKLAENLIVAEKIHRPTMKL